VLLSIFSFPFLAHPEEPEKPEQPPYPEQHPTAGKLEGKRLDGSQ
jgi:hypothetical protein